MRLGVLSDTHGSVENTRRAARLLESLEAERLLHCGDIGSPDVVRTLAPWPCHYVLGNCDEHPGELAAAIEAAGQTFCGEFGDLEFDGVRVALLHSHDRARFREVIGGGEYGLVCYGHSHKKAIDRRGDTLLLNPGALHRANPHSIAIVDLPACEATLVDL